ncbi:IS110 family transposase [Lachnospiraceae bacterium ZAX-1]
MIDSDGVVHTGSLRIENSKSGFEPLCTTSFSILDPKDLKNVKIGLEATGHYSISITSSLISITSSLFSKGFQVHILNPLATNLFRKAGTLRKTKTDKTDAKAIVAMLFTDESKSYSPVSYQISELKPLAKHRCRLPGHRSKLKLSATRLVDIIFPELPGIFWSVHQNSSYTLLSEFSTPKDICDCHLTKLSNLLSRASHGKYGKEKAAALKELAANSIGSSNRSTAFELQQTIRLINTVQLEMDALDKQIKEAVDELDTPLITVPGIGYTICRHNPG